MIAQYSTAPPAQDPTTSYTVTDQLGSPRVITNSQGEVVSRRDFMPFGEQVAADGTYRTPNLYSTGDNIRQKFTGYQKDDETSLDFAEARMYENRHGRFTAVDPLLASGKSANPQTFNRYVYVLNNPKVFVDADGLYPVFWDQKNLYSRTQYKGFVRYEGPPTIIKASNGWYYIVTKDELTRTKQWRKAERILEQKTVGFKLPLETTLKTTPYINWGLIKSLADHGAGELKLVATLEAGAILAGTGVGLYLYSAGVAGTTLTTLGIAGSDYVAAHPGETQQELQQLAKFLDKPPPQGLRVNLGGTGEMPGYVNINSLAQSTSATGSEVPNLIVGNASEIGALIPQGQKIAEIASNNFTAINMNWARFAQGAFGRMAEGGQLRLGLHGVSMETINGTIIPALRNAGFSNINVVGGSFIYATR